jgi:hypothetical protein
VIGKSNRLAIGGIPMTAKHKSLRFLAMAAALIAAGLLWQDAYVPLAHGGDPPPSFPSECNSPTGPEGACCVYGYVYLHGEPAEGASVTIQSTSGVTNTITASGTLSSYAYYTVSLSEPPLEVTPGGVITVTAACENYDTSITYQVVAGWQQVDVVIPVGSSSGTGADGDLTVTGTLYVDNTRTALSGTAGPGQRVLPVSDTSGFATGQEVLIVQMQGADTGNHEYGRIASVDSGIITLEHGLQYTYTVGSYDRDPDGFYGAPPGVSAAQVIAVPNYRTVTIVDGGVLTAHGWNGVTGGIVALRVSDSLVVQSGGSIDVNGLGYRGGNGGRDTGSGSAAYTGEGWPGPPWSLPGDVSGGPYGSRAANGNGGGSGFRTSDNIVTKRSGAGGGHATTGGEGGPGYGSGQGGRTVDDASGVMLFFGGGGGGGIATNQTGPRGGNGGGMILLFAKSVTVTGSILSKGHNGCQVHDAGSGGGAGGYVLLVGKSIGLGSSNVIATGGSGVDGDGGDGRIRIEYGESLSGSTNPQATVQQQELHAAPIATIHSISPNPATLADDVVFYGSGQDQDENGESIIGYLWRTGTITLSTSATFTVGAAALGTGTHPIYFTVMDDEAEWSEEISATLQILEPATETFTVLLVPGWNLVSIPLHPTDTSITQVLASLAGSYDLVYVYAGCDAFSPWRRFDPYAPPFANDLTGLDETTGFWIHATVTDTLVVTGTVPSTTTTLLCTGWNLVGYPSLQAESTADALASIAGEYGMVYGFDSSDVTSPWEKYDPGAPPFANDLNEMIPGGGYWIKVSEDCTWAVSD